MISHRTGIGAAVFCLIAIGCSSGTPSTGGSAPPPATQAGAQAATDARRYPLKGKVVAVDRAGMQITVDHEAIPGFMGAMTMAYPVKDVHQLDGLDPGAQITATVVSTGQEFWLEGLARSGSSAPPAK